MFGGKGVELASSVKPVQPDYKAVMVSYVTKEQWKGFANQEIEQALKKAGWPSLKINDALNEAAKHPMHRYRKRIIGSAAVLALLLTIIFILSSSAVYFVIENIVYIVVSTGVAAIGGIVLLYVKNKQKKPKVMDEAPKRALEAKPGEYETDIDLLYKMLLEKKRLKLSDIMSQFGVPEKHALEWAKILETHGLARLKYPAFGEPELVML